MDWEEPYESMTHNDECFKFSEMYILGLKLMKSV